MGNTVYRIQNSSGLKTKNRRNPVGFYPIKFAVSVLKKIF